MRSLDWSTEDWRSRFFKRRRTRRLPEGWRSQARQAWDEALARQEQRARAFELECASHARELAEKDEVDRWRDVVEAYGSDAVEAIVGRTRPGFRLPVALRGRAAQRGGVGQ
jgi:hypothetical protein